MPRTIPRSSLSWRNTFYVSPEHDLFETRVDPTQVHITCNGQPYDVVKCHKVRRCQRYQRYAFRQATASPYDPVLLFHSDTSICWYHIFTKERWMIPLSSSNNSLYVTFSPWHRWLVLQNGNGHTHVYDQWTHVMHTLLVDVSDSQFAVQRFSAPDELVFISLQGDYSIWDLPQGTLQRRGHFPFDTFKTSIGPMIDSRHLLLLDQDQIRYQPLHRKRARIVSASIRMDFRVHAHIAPDRQSLVVTGLDHQTKQYVLKAIIDGAVCATFLLRGPANDILPHVIMVEQNKRWTLYSWIRVQPYQDALHTYLPLTLCQLVLLYRFPVYFCQHPQVLFPDL